MGKPKDKHKKKKWFLDRRSKLLALYPKRNIKHNNTTNNIQNKFYKKLNKNTLGEYHKFVSPKYLDFEENPEDTIKYFSDIRTAKSDDRIKIDLIPLRYIAPSCIVILAAEMNRHTINSKKKFVVRDYNKWDNLVKLQLNQIGFFKYMKMGKKKVEIQDDIKWLKLSSYNNFNDVNDKLAELQYKIIELLPENTISETVRSRLYSVLYESLANTLEHAYPQKYGFTSENQRWWCAAYYNKTNSNLKVIVYDMGVTIPTSIKNKYIIENNKVIGIEKKESKIIFDKFEDLFNSHCKIIKDMIQKDDNLYNHGSSATKLANRGYGLYKMRNFIKEYFTHGRFSIISNKGYCVFMIEHGKETIYEQDFTNRLSGTLIEWDLFIDKGDNDE